ncbi:MAG TPA: hypothetical protein ENG51_17960 [Deltaproteobacteria bacterium]|nr:MAG: hypothetical protein DRH15_01645 [Deltaproteobacteria bacterium]HDM78324.1 hypothetical protein [Deltaproteobacteria bacterium]
MYIKWKNKGFFVKVMALSVTIAALACYSLFGQSLLYTGEYIIINFDNSRPLSNFVYKEIAGAPNKYARIAGHDMYSTVARDRVGLLKVSGDARVLDNGVLLSPTDATGKLEIVFAFTSKDVVYFIEVFYENRGFCFLLCFDPLVTIYYGGTIKEDRLPHGENHSVIVPSWEQNIVISGREFIAHSAGAFVKGFRQIIFEASGLEEVLIKEIRIHISPPYRGSRRY